MAVNVLKTISEHTAKLAYKTSLYHWSLSGSIPDHIRVKPIDPWPGNSDGARFLCSGSLVIDDLQADLHTGWHVLRSIYQHGWRALESEDHWISFLHSFRWLRDLRALGGDLPRRTARTLMINWIKHYGRWEEKVWSSGVMGERIAMWTSLFDFFGESADDEFQTMFFEAIICQARHLARELPGEEFGINRLQAIKGLLYAGISFSGEELWIEQALSLLHIEIHTQILPDGGHISRSPQQLFEALQIFVDIRGALVSAGYPVPSTIQHAIDRMVPAIKFFRHADKGFAVFQGAQEGDQALVDCVLAQAKSKSRALPQLPATGYEKMSVGRTSLIIDCGKPPAYPHDRHAHASPLAFELCHGKDRIFVSCGSHPTSENWQEALRTTAAHNALTLNDHDACAINEGGHFGRKVQNLAIGKDADKSRALLETSHDGYLTLNGLQHKRRFILADNGNHIMGEDIISGDMPPANPVDITVRFHLHPKVLVSLVREGEQALLRLSSGLGWVFTVNGAKLRMENSIYLGEGVRPRKTKQLVLTTRLCKNMHKQINWSLKRAG